MALTDNESAALMINTSFQGRVKVCALRYAQALMAQTSPPATGAEYRWANQVMNNPQMFAGTLASPTVLDPGIQGAGIDTTSGDSTADDATVYAAVQAVANRLM